MSEMNCIYDYVFYFQHAEFAMNKELHPIQNLCTVTLLALLQFSIANDAHRAYVATVLAPWFAKRSKKFVHLMMVSVSTWKANE